jgi:hypothetical protein
MKAILVTALTAITALAAGCSSAAQPAPHRGATAPATPAGPASPAAVTPSTLTSTQACRRLLGDLIRNGGAPDIPTLRRIADRVTAPRLAADARTAVRDIDHTGVAPVALSLLRADCAEAGVQIPAP